LEVVVSNGAVLWDVDGPLGRITLNRPEVLNAMNLEWVQALDAAVAAVGSAPDVRVVLVRGAGRAFCSGIDLDMLGTEGMPAGFLEGQERAFHRLETMDKIVVAALHGHCLGGGLQLAIACDIRVCSTDCGLGLPAILEGLFPAMATFRLPRLIGLGPARRLILSGELVTPEEALRLGVVDYLAPPERFEARLDEVLRLYLEAPHTAAVASKRLMNRVFNAEFDTVLQESLPLMADCLASPEVAAAGQVWQRRRASRRSQSS
jgi:enoyl-CoA hydratase/carnithine racemase